MRLLSADWPYLLPDHFRSLPIAAVLWAFWGVLGAHKLYLGQPLMAALYVPTFGLFFVGWLLDLPTLAAQVSWCNARLELGAQRQKGVPGPRWRPRRPEEMRMALLEFARGHGGTVTVTEGVLATGASFSKVERVLQEMATSGYVDVGNDPQSGVVRYRFPELVPGDWQQVHP